MGGPRKLYARESSNASGETETSTENDNTDPDGEVFFDLGNLTVTEDPTTWKQAKQTENAELWKGALEDEVLAQIKNKTWEITKQPENHKVIDSRYVFCTKSDGCNQTRKVPLVARGCSQKQIFHRWSDRRQ